MVRQFASLTDRRRLSFLARSAGFSALFPANVARLSLTLRRLAIMIVQESSVKKVDLIEMSNEELGGQKPVIGTEMLVHGIRYLIVDAKPPKVITSRWRKKPPGHRAEKWKLLVERVDQSTP
jgi:hypothetical protein